MNSVAHTLHRRACELLRPGSNPKPEEVRRFLDDVLMSAHQEAQQDQTVLVALDDALIRTVLQRECDHIEAYYSGDDALTLLDVAIPDPLNGIGAMFSGLDAHGIQDKKTADSAISHPVDDDILRGVLTLTRTTPVEIKARASQGTLSHLPRPRNPTIETEVATRPSRLGCGTAGSGRNPTIETEVATRRIVASGIFGSWTSGLSLLLGGSFMFFLGVFSADHLDGFLPGFTLRADTIVSDGSQASPVGSTITAQDPVRFETRRFDFSWPAPQIGPKALRTDPALPSTQPSKGASPRLDLDVTLDDLTREGTSTHVTLGIKPSRKTYLIVYAASNGQKPLPVHKSRVDGTRIKVEYRSKGDQPEMLALASDAPLALEGAALEEALVGIRDPRTALEAIRVWAFQEALNRQTTLTVARIPLN